MLLGPALLGAYYLARGLDHLRDYIWPPDPKPARSSARVVFISTDQEER